MTTMNAKAIFYPNLCFSTTVRVADSSPVEATNDLGCASSEARHFVDFNYLRRIGYVEESMLVAPTPPCSSLSHKMGEERVLGMLKKRLSVSLYLPKGGCGKNDEKYEPGWSMVKLSNVLVVNALPVPLHISLKTLELYPGFQGGPNTRPPSRGTFPAEFHSHPYWSQEASNRSAIGNFGMPGYEEHKQAIDDGRTGKATKTKPGKNCLSCGASNAKKFCTHCPDSVYCSKDCQRAHWPQHRRVCQRPTRPQS